MATPFCFILNPLEVSGVLPFELIPGLFLQRANAGQTDLIKEQLIKHGVNGSPVPPAYEYEWLPPVSDGKSGYSWSSQSLPTDRFRYWVVTASGDNVLSVFHLQEAINLLRSDFDFGFCFSNFGSNGSLGVCVPGSLGTGLLNLTSADPLFTVTELDVAELACVGRYHQAIQTCEKEHPNISRAIRTFADLKSLPRNSNLVVLGYFSVIESLVTHDPKDDFDSLNHQISTKMVLLSKLFERRLDYKSLFGDHDPERVWKKLYSYRSALAHGAAADFKSKFQVLKDSSTASSFLKEATKLTLLFAMKDPEFLADLQKC